MHPFQETHGGLQEELQHEGEHTTGTMIELAT
jgi:hypothetical protein